MIFHSHASSTLREAASNQAASHSHAVRGRGDVRADVLNLYARVAIGACGASAGTVETVRKRCRASNGNEEIVAGTATKLSSSGTLYSGRSRGTRASFCGSGANGADTRGKDSTSKTAVGSAR